MSQHIFSSQFKGQDVTIMVEWLEQDDQYRMSIQDMDGTLLFDSNRDFLDSGKFRSAPLLAIMAFCEEYRIQLPPKLLLRVKQDRQQKRSRQVFYDG